MRIDQWLELKRTKAFCIGLSLVFAYQQVVWAGGGDAVQLLKVSTQQMQAAEATLKASIYTIYQDLYSREPTAAELQESLEFVKRNPRLSYLIERLSQSPESRWRLRQLNPERIKRRKTEAARISDAVSRMVGDFLRKIAAESSTGQRANGPTNHYYLSPGNCPPDARVDSPQRNRDPSGRILVTRS